MPELVDDVLELLAPWPSANALAREIGFDSATSAATAAQLAVPLIVAGMVHQLNDAEASQGLIEVVRTVDTTGLHDFGSTLADRRYEPSGSDAVKQILGQQHSKVAALLAPQVECVEQSAIDVFPPMAWAVTGLIAKRNGRDHTRHSLLQIIRNEHDGLLRTGWGEWMSAVDPPEFPSADAAAIEETETATEDSSHVSAVDASEDANGDIAARYPPPVPRSSRTDGEEAEEGSGIETDLGIDPGAEVGDADSGGEFAVTEELHGLPLQDGLLGEMQQAGSGTEGGWAVKDDEASAVDGDSEQPEAAAGDTEQPEAAAGETIVQQSGAIQPDDVIEPDAPLPEVEAPAADDQPDADAAEALTATDEDATNGDEQPTADEQPAADEQPESDELAASLQPTADEPPGGDDSDAEVEDETKPLDRSELDGAPSPAPLVDPDDSGGLINDPVEPAETMRLEESIQRDIAAALSGTAEAAALGVEDDAVVAAEDDARDLASSTEDLIVEGSPKSDKDPVPGPQDLETSAPGTSVPGTPALEVPAFEKMATGAAPQRMPNLGDLLPPSAGGPPTESLLPPSINQKNPISRHPGGGLGGDGGLSDPTGDAAAGRGTDPELLKALSEHQANPTESPPSVQSAIAEAGLARPADNYYERELGSDKGIWVVIGLGIILFGGAVLWFLTEDDLDSAIGGTESTTASTVDDPASAGSQSESEVIPFDVTLSDQTGSTSATATAALQLDVDGEELCYDIDSVGLGETVNGQIVQGSAGSATSVAELGLLMDTAIGCIAVNSSILEAVVADPAAHQLSLIASDGAGEVRGTIGG